MSDKRSENNNLSGEVWDPDDDILLAKTILQFVRQGDTVINACREMEVITEGRRTASASKFRWFTKLVDQYKAGYELAKAEGKKVKEKKKKKVNKGERFEEIVQDVFESKEPATSRELTPDDFIILAKKFREQEQNKAVKMYDLESENSTLRSRNRRLEEQLKKESEEVSWYKDMLLVKQRDYNKIVEALKTLKDLGVAIQVPEPESPQYVVDKNGIVEKK